MQGLPDYLNAMKLDYTHAVPKLHQRALVFLLGLVGPTFKHSCSFYKPMRRSFAD
jgi:hypothetical protein